MSSAARLLAWSINSGSIPVAVLCLDILPNYRISEYHNSNFKKHLHTYSNIFSTLIIAPLSPRSVTNTNFTENSGILYTRKEKRVRGDMKPHSQPQPQPQPRPRPNPGDPGKLCAKTSAIIAHVDRLWPVA
jgi:hypothetical protein